MKRTTRFVLRFAPITLLLMAGCGAIFGNLANAMPHIVKARYTGMPNQAVGILVWADDGTVIDWSTIRVDLARGIQKNIAESKADEVKDVTFPYPPESIIRYERDHPGVENLPIADLAPKLGVTRLIYVEVTGFRTRANSSTVALYRGSVLGSLKIIEVANGVGKVAYEEDNISVVFPKKVPEDGVLNSDDYKMYLGTLDAFATEIAGRVFTHEVEDD